MSNDQSTTNSSSDPVEEEVITGPVREIGTTEDDTLYGTDFNDVLRGLFGDDTLDGFGGDDLLVGGVGNDIIYLGEGTNDIWGDVQNNNTWKHADRFVVDSDQGENTIHDFDADSGDVLVFTRKSGLLLSELDFAVVDGNTVISDASGTWSIKLIGVQWNSLDDAPDGAVEGIFGPDIVGGSGDDLLVGTRFNDIFNGLAGDDTIHGGKGNDLLEGRSGEDKLYGGDGDDALVGGRDNDELYGGADNDHLGGSGGDDSLDGGTGDDVLVGGTGSDDLIGGEGDDILWGNHDSGAGSEADRFIFFSNSGDDVIKDFSAAEGDVIAIEIGFFNNLEQIRLNSFQQVFDASVQTENGVLIDLGFGNSVLLEGVMLDSLTDANFEYLPPISSDELIPS